MWLATGDMGADLSKDFSKKVLEIVLDTEILAPLGVLGVGKDKTPKAFATSEVSVSFIVCYRPLKFSKFRAPQVTCHL